VPDDEAVRFAQELLDVFVEGGWPAHGVYRALPANVAAKLFPHAELLERRVYRDARVTHALRATGVQFVEWGESLLFQFPSLEARAQAWTEVTGKLGSCPSYEFSLFRWS